MEVPRASVPAPRVLALAAAATLGLGALLSLFAGSWFGWYPHSEGQLTLLGRSWAGPPQDPECVSCSGGYLFNPAIAATVFAPFTVAAAFLLAERRTVTPREDATTLAVDAAGWAVAALVFVAVGVAGASNPASWNAGDVVGGDATFNWAWASAAAMFALLGAAILRSGRATTPRTSRRRSALACGFAAGGIVIAYLVARHVGSYGSDFGRGRLANGAAEGAPSRTNWLVFTPLASGCVAAAVIRVADLGASPRTGTGHAAARRLDTIAAFVALVGASAATALAWRFRLSSHRLFDWSGSSARPDRFNWTLFGLVIGPALVASAAIARRADVARDGARRSGTYRNVGWIAVPVLGIVLAALLAGHVGSDAERMSVLRGGDDGRPLFNRFVFLAAGGPFVAIGGAAAAGVLGGRSSRRGSVEPGPPEA